MVALNAATVAVSVTGPQWAQIGPISSPQRTALVAGWIKGQVDEQAEILLESEQQNLIAAIWRDCPQVVAGFAQTDAPVPRNKPDRITTRAFCRLSTFFSPCTVPVIQSFSLALPMADGKLHELIATALNLEAGFSTRRAIIIAAHFSTLEEFLSVNSAELQFKSVTGR